MFLLLCFIQGEKTMKVTKEMREFVVILRNNGYEYIRTRGSHHIFENHVSHRTISVNKDLNKMVRQRLIKEYHLQ